MCGKSDQFLAHEDGPTLRATASTVRSDWLPTSDAASDRLASDRVGC
jgi:hypothetical protein